MLFDFLNARRPVVDIQAEPSDCGYLCLSALFSTFGKRVPLDRIKGLSGRTSRGLNIKQLRDAARSCGFEAQAVYFDKSKPAAIPEFGILLMSYGHYVAVVGRKGTKFEVYDPQTGWLTMSHRRLQRRSTGMGIEVAKSLPNGVGAIESPEQKSPVFSVSKLLSDSSTSKALGILLVAQAVTLALPLLSMWSVDRSFDSFSLDLAGAIALGFVALTVTSFLLTFVGELTFVRVQRFAAVALSKRVFGAISAKDASWFENSRSSTLNHRISSAYIYLDFRLRTIRMAVTTLLTLIIGLGFIVFVSPWLAIPGLITLIFSLVVNVVFHNAERTAFTTQVDATQRRQSFVFDVLGQLPLLVRHGSLANARTRYIANNRAVAHANSRVQVIRTWRDSIESFLGSMETLLFVVIAAVFMGKGDFTVGGFVALGAYKDLLARSLASLFQLYLQARNYEVHRMQAEAVLETADEVSSESRQATEGRMTANDLSFGYSSFEEPVFEGVTFGIQPGESVAICGSSGCGKSTLLKVLAGQIQPTSGEAMIDGQRVDGTMRGVSSVLQSDRIIGGTIRDNIALYRPDVRDADVLSALKLAQIDEFVMSLPMRLDTNVHESVVGLSGGQRQRLLLARALIAKPRLLILDEATSSLQVDMERQIIQELRNLRCTLLLVTHRPEVWDQMDRVFVMEDGRVTERNRQQNESGSNTL